MLKLKNNDLRVFLKLAFNVLDFSERGSNSIKLTSKMCVQVSTTRCRSSQAHELGDRDA